MHLLPRSSACLLAASIFSVSWLAGAESPEAIEGYQPKWSEAERYIDIFSPLTTDNAALSPDGESIAYTARRGDELWLITASVDSDAETRHFFVGRDADAAPGLHRRDLSDTPLEVRWLSWVTPDQIVIETNTVRLNYEHAEWTAYPGRIVVLDLADNSATQLADPVALGRQITTSRNRGFPTPADPRGYGYDERLPSSSWTHFHRTDGHFVYQRQDRYGNDREVFREPTGKGFPTFGALHGHDSRAFHHYGSRRNRSYFEGQTDPFPNSARRGSTGTILQPLAPVTVLGYNPDNEEEIFVRAGPKTDFDQYAINVVTHERRLVRNERVTDGKTVLLDRQHEANLALPNTTRSSFPLEYLYDEPRFFSLLRWKKLDAFIDTPATPIDFTVSPENVLSGRSIPVGFDEDPDLLYFASDVGRDTFGLYAVQLSTGEMTDFVIEHPQFDLVPPTFDGFPQENVLIFDRFTRGLFGVRYEAEGSTAAWLHPGWQELQNGLEDAFPAASIDVLEWDRGYERFLISVQSPTDPGGYYLYDRTENTMLAVGQRAPELADRDAETLHFTFDGPTGRDIHARVAVPTDPIHDPVPLVILFPDNPWERIGANYDREAMALARMGYAVVQFNGRGAWGFGRDDRTAIKEGYETTQADEIVALTDYMREHFLIHPEKVALVGEGSGGYLALRTLQEHSDAFRCAVAINAPFDPVATAEKLRWNQRDASAKLLQTYFKDPAGNTASPLLDAPERIGKPVLLFAYREEDGPDGAPDYRYPATMVNNVRARGIPAELENLHPAYHHGIPGARADVFARISGFLNTHMFDYDAEPRDFESYLEEDTPDTLSFRETERSRTDSVSVKF